MCLNMVQQVHLQELILETELLDKQRLLAVTKSDMLDEQLIAEMRTHLPEGIPALFISSVTGYNIPQLKDLLWEALHK